MREGYARQRCKCESCGGDGNAFSPHRDSSESEPHFSVLRQRLLALRDGYRREPEGDEFSGVVPSADGNNDVLLAIKHVSTGRPTLRRRHVDGADFMAGGFIIGAQHGAASAGRGGGKHRLASDY